MTLEIAAVYALIVLALALFATERFRVDVTAVLVMAILMISGILTPEEGLRGFANVATVTVGAMFVLSAGIRRTGALEVVAELFGRLGERSSTLALVAMMLTIGVVSAFINNTAAVAIFIPVVIALARDLGRSPSKLLMPLSYASMFGGVCTLIGTSTNLLVSAIVVERGLEPFGLFEFAPLGLVFFAIGMAYLFVARPFIPARRAEGDLEGSYDVGGYVTDVRLADDAADVGRTPADATLLSGLDLELLEIYRGGEPRGGGEGDERATAFEQGDVLRVLGPAEAIAELLERGDVTLLPHIGPDETRELESEADGAGETPETSDEALDEAMDETLDEPGETVEPEGGDAEADRPHEGLETDRDALIEGVIAPDSRLEGQTVGDIDFPGQFGAQVLALRQAGELRREALSEIRLRGGASLLLRIDRERLDQVRQDRDFVIVSEVQVHRGRPDKMPLAIGIVLAVVALAGFGVIPILESAVGGCLLMVLTGVLRAEEAYEAINWQVVFLLAGILSLGTAMETTGAAEQLADAIVAAVGAYGGVAVLSAFFLLSQMLTNVISNNATAALLAPVAIATATGLGLDPRPFALAVTFAASLSFMTPIGYQTNTLIYGPGQYRFSDFLKIGTPLNLIFWIVGTLLIPVIWPL